MKTTTQISIATPSPTLEKYTHCSAPSRGVGLRDAVEELEDAGFAVLSATGSRNAVPNKYQSAYKMHAPYYVYRGGDREVELVDGPLENRSNGTTIPAHFEIAGGAVPAGFRCFKRDENSLMIRRI